MPTRSGLDHHTINPEYFVCSYCYCAAPNNIVSRREGMVRKRVTVRVDDGVNDWEELDEWTRVWTQPHCNQCDRKIRGIHLRLGLERSTLKRFKYDA